jgi:hypothetical protein
MANKLPPGASEENIESIPLATLEKTGVFPAVAAR